MENEKLGYLYMHRRNDTGEIFYIGISFDKTFKRARDKTNRNRFWKNIANTTDYTIEIPFKNMPEKALYSKEIELILCYGRRDLKTGPLCNLRKGGPEGNPYAPNSEENRNKTSIRQKGKPLHPNIIAGRDKYWEEYKKNKPPKPPKVYKPKPKKEKQPVSLETRQKMSNNMKLKIQQNPEVIEKLLQGARLNAKKSRKPVIQFDLNGKLIKRWNSMHEAFLAGFSKRRISNCCKGIYKSYNGFQWQEDKGQNSCSPIPKFVQPMPIILQLDKSGNEIKTWFDRQSLKDANFNPAEVLKVCRGFKRCKSHKGFLWRIKGEDIKRH